MDPAAANKSAVSTPMLHPTAASGSLPMGLASFEVRALKAKGVCVCVYIYIYVCVYVCVCIYIYMYVCMLLILLYTFIFACWWWSGRWRVVSVVLLCLP